MSCNCGGRMTRKFNYVNKVLMIEYFRCDSCGRIHIIKDNR